MSTIPSTTLSRPDEVFYPSEDDEPMGETDWHVYARFLIYSTLKARFADRQDVYVASDLFLYYEEGDASKKKAPDCMVVFGVETHFRRIFQTWREGAIPTVIFEIASSSTFHDDLDEKCALYERLGVPEYYLFDPEGSRLEPRLQGLVLEAGRYVEMVPDADGGLTSPALGLRMVAEGVVLRFIDTETGEPLLTPDEKDAAIRREANRRRTERRRADREKRRAEHEQRRAEALAAEVERLKAMLQQQRRPDGKNGG